ncbi:MAG: hypothetical protein A2136_03550 [Chloroflexi bacterium RBG_16_54_11]|nr:MAG: hypothetical protein A2136_03550 [Chloroflexi bacterium RBG_16_54_11]
MKILLVGSTSTMKKYYYAGATRVAMRTGSSTINYLLGDHLGSQAITADANGGKISEVRYYQWGEDRYYAYTSSTTHRFTGQRYETGIGLYFLRGTVVRRCGVSLQTRQPADAEIHL